MASKSYLAHGFILYFSHVSFSEFEAAILFLLPEVQTSIRHRIFYNVKCFKLIARVYFTTQNTVFV